MLIQLGFQKACWNQQVENTKQGVIDLFYNAKFDFKSTANHDSTAYHHKHLTCQYPGEDMMELTSAWPDILRMNRIIGKYHWCLGVMADKEKNHFNG